MKPMEATLMFDTARARDLAIPELEKLGFKTERLGWEDRHEGVLLSHTTWLQVRASSDLDDNGFFHEMEALAEQLNGDICEAGEADPLPQQ